MPQNCTPGGEGLRCSPRPPRSHPVEPAQTSLEDLVGISSQLCLHQQHGAGLTLAMGRSIYTTEVGEPYQSGFLFFPLITNSPHCSCPSLVGGLS